MPALERALHDAHGAVWTSDGAQVRNYGDPAAEYNAARTGVAIIDRSDRAFIRVYGRDPVRMVQGLISNDIASTVPGRAVYAAVLTAKGRMVADVRVVRHGAELLLETDARALEPLTAHLGKFVPPLFARFEAATLAWSVIGVHGPHARQTVSDVLRLHAGSNEDDAMAATFDDESGFVVTTSYIDVPGFDIVVPAAHAAAIWQQLTAANAQPIGHATLDVLRIEAGRPRWGAELDDTTIPLEAGLRERAISETKGCYTGQEVIIRILHRGHVNWELRGVLLGDIGAPAHDTPLVDASSDKRLGRITSAAWSPSRAQTIALAYVRREIEPPAQLQLGIPSGPTVTVVSLPFPSA